MKFSKDGKFIKAWGKKGTGPGEFDTPHALALRFQRPTGLLVTARTIGSRSSIRGEIPRRMETIQPTERDFH